MFQLQCFLINFHRKFAFVFIVTCFIEFEVFIGEKIRFFPTTECTKFIIWNVYQTKMDVDTYYMIAYVSWTFVFSFFFLLRNSFSSLIIIFSHNILNIVSRNVSAEKKQLITIIGGVCKWAESQSKISSEEKKWSKASNSI